LIKIVVLILTILNSWTVNAELFKNSYVSFELPPHWTCKTEVTEWVCISQYNQKSKEAMIILTAKEKGPTDSLEQYETYLKGIHSIPSKRGTTLNSHVYTVKRIQVNGHPWVDGLHINSEIENYYTRYLATFKDSVSVLVTFSGHKEHYTKYSQDFFKAIQSLRVMPPQMQNFGSGSGKGGSTNPSGGTFGTSVSDPLDPGGMNFPEEMTNTESDNKTTLLAIILILAAVGIYLIKKKKKK
jgi:LPXTG-motif cell wall-anchored protein